MTTDTIRSIVHYAEGRFGPDGPCGVLLQEQTGAIITQFSFFKNQKAAVTKYLSASCAASLPGPGQSAAADKAVIARIEPQKIWHIGVSAPNIQGADAFYPLDMSGARRILDITGPDAAHVMARLCSADLRESSFATGQMLSTGMHHVGVQVLRLDSGFRVIIPRSFAESLFDLIADISAQFGVEIKKPAPYQG